MNSFEKGANGVDGGGVGEYKNFRDANETKRERNERASDERKDALKTEKSKQRPSEVLGCYERKRLILIV